MISSRNYHIVISIIVACICATAFSAEPNESKTELKFEISNRQLGWLTNSGRNKGTGPTKPTHVAKFFIKGERSYKGLSLYSTKDIRATVTNRILPEPEDIIKMMLQTTAGRSISRKQREFIATSDAFTEMEWGKRVRNYREYHLYAVSEMDAKKMVEAFVEVLAEKANTTMQKYNDFLHKVRETIVQVKEILPEKEAQAKAAGSKYKEIKDARYSLISDNEAYEMAKETTVLTDKKLDNLEIELAGIKEKLKSIEKFRSTKSLGGHRFSDETLDKLDQMLVEQIIELRSTEARKEASHQIRNREKRFLDCFNQWQRLDGEVAGLKSDIPQYESGILKIKRILANPTPDMLPPKLYQNTVTIHPVFAE